MIETLAILGSPIEVESHELFRMIKKYFSSLLSSVLTSLIGIVIELQYSFSAKIYGIKNNKFIIK